MCRIWIVNRWSLMSRTEPGLHGWTAFKDTISPSSSCSIMTSSISRNKTWEAESALTFDIDKIYHLGNKPKMKGVNSIINLGKKSGISVRQRGGSPPKAHSPPSTNHGKHPIKICNRCNEGTASKISNGQKGEPKGDRWERGAKSTKKGGQRQQSHSKRVRTSRNEVVKIRYHRKVM